ncbi:MAG: hypothetical protein ACLGJC_31570 [Alphaproteobacteria bacterium]
MLAGIGPLGHPVLTLTLAFGPFPGKGLSGIRTLAGTFRGAGLTRIGLRRRHALARPLGRTSLTSGGSTCPSRRSLSRDATAGWGWPLGRKAPAGGRTGTGKSTAAAATAPTPAAATLRVGIRHCRGHQQKGQEH